MAHAVAHFQFVNRRDRQRRTPLHWAAHGGHAGIIRVLLYCGADPTVCDVDGATATELAAGLFHNAAVQELLNKLMDVTDKIRTSVQHSVDTKDTRNHVLCRIQREVNKQKELKLIEKKRSMGVV